MPETAGAAAIVVHDDVTGVREERSVLEGARQTLELPADHLDHLLHVATLDPAARASWWYPNLFHLTPASAGTGLRHV